jgi:hypothetical protein
LVKRIVGIGLIVFVFGLVGERSLLTGLVRKSLLDALAREAQVAEEIELEIAPLGLLDLLNGQVGEFSFTATRFGFAGGPVFTNVSLHSEGMHFDPDALLQKEFIIRELRKTGMTLELPEAELTTMMRRDLPELEPTVFLEENRVELEGFLVLFGQGRLPFRASATLEKASDRSLRLTPLGLKVAGVPLWAELFQKYAQEISWEFPLEIPWPVRLRHFQVAPGVIKMEWQEVGEEDHK